MDTHPNVILLVALTPDGLARKTMRDILEEEYIGKDCDVHIGPNKYHHFVAESDYEEDYQISSKEGSLIFFNMATYGYGEDISWAKLESRKDSLEEWARGVCKRHHCTYEIKVTANYW